MVEKNVSKTIKGFSGHTRVYPREIRVLLSACLWQIMGAQRTSSTSAAAGDEEEYSLGASPSGVVNNNSNLNGS